MALANPHCICGDPVMCNDVELPYSPCCDCLPLRLCAVFRAAECECDGNWALLHLDANQEFIGGLRCGEQVADLLVYVLYEEETCYWHVLSEELEIDKKFEIGPGEQSCEDPQLSVDAEFELCSGTIEFRRHELAWVPPRTVDEVELPWCGSCECACKVLCVAYNLGDHITRDELEWDPETHSWGDIELVRDEETGGCVVLVDGFDPIPITVCDQGIGFFGRNDIDQAVAGRCKTCGTCDDVCIGCCFPLEYDPYFGWHPKEIPFSISAPNCAAANSFSGSFDPQASHDKRLGACGVCGIYNSTDMVQIQGQAFFENGSECGTTPCPVWLCFALECDDIHADPYNDNCCDKVRLILGVNGSYVGTSAPPPTSFLECTSFIRIAPTSCECDENGAISAVFPLDGLTFQCETFFPSGPCNGQPTCCMPISCSLEGATLVI